MVLINLSHPLAPAQLKEVETMLGTTVQEVLEVPVQLDPMQSFEIQIRQLVDQLQARLEDGLLASVLFCLPGHSPACALLLAEWHGRVGAFPSFLRRRPVEGSIPTRFEVAEIVNLQAVRDASRPHRWSE